MCCSSRATRLKARVDYFYKCSTSSFLSHFYDPSHTLRSLENLHGADSIIPSTSLLPLDFEHLFARIPRAFGHSCQEVRDSMNWTHNDMSRPAHILVFEQNCNLIVDNLMITDKDASPRATEMILMAVLGSPRQVALKLWLQQKAVL